MYNFYLWDIHLRINFTVVQNNVQKRYSSLHIKAFAMLGAQAKKQTYNDTTNKKKILHLKRSLTNMLLRKTRASEVSSFISS